MFGSVGWFGSLAPLNTLVIGPCGCLSSLAPLVVLFFLLFWFV